MEILRQAQDDKNGAQDDKNGAQDDNTWYQVILIPGLAPESGSSR